MKPNKKDATFSYIISKRGPIDYIDNGKDFLVSLGHHDYMSIWSMDIADLEILVNICKSITRPEDQDFVRKIKDAYHERTLNS